MQYSNPLRSFHLLFTLTLFVLIRHPAAVTIIEILAVVGVVIWAAGYRLIRVRIEPFQLFYAALSAAASFPGVLGEIGFNVTSQAFRENSPIWPRDKTG